MIGQCRDAKSGIFGLVLNDFARVDVGVPHVTRIVQCNSFRLVQLLGVSFCSISA